MEHWPRGLRHFPAKKENGDKLFRWFESNMLRHITHKGNKMHKPTASFKLSKSAKRMIASTPDKGRASLVKKMMIEAELSAAIQPKRERVRREGNSE